MVAKVFISSTGKDLQEYRQEAKEQTLKAGFMPVMSEHWAASGEFPPLEKCLKVVPTCDLLMVIVAHRYGWIPPDQIGSGHKSITWLECEQAAGDGQEVIAFVVDDHADWRAEDREEYQATLALLDGTATPARLAAIKQGVEGLKEFKAWLGSRGIRAIFKTPADLRSEVIAALNDWRIRHLYSADTASTLVLDEVSPTKALRHVLEQTRLIDIRGLQVGSGKAYHFPIKDLYIPLTSVSSGARQTASTEGREIGTQEAAQGHVELQVALQNRRLVIVGDPGSGKTTFLRRIAYTIAETLLGIDPNAAQKWLGMKEQPPFSLFLRLADLNAFVEREKRGVNSVPATDDSPEWLVKFFGRVALENAWGLDEEFFRKYLSSGACILLLDGFDEAPSLTSRKALTQLIEKAAAVYDRCQFVLTSRPRAFADGALFNSDFKRVQVAPLTEEAVNGFLTHWCNALFPDAPDQAQAHRPELDRALETRSEIRRMATNAVMLTALTVVHWNEKRLPEQRADLYESIITWLGRARETRRGRMPAERCLTLLQEVALALLCHQEGRQIEVSRRWAAEQIMDHFAQLEVQPIEAAEHFLSEEKLDSGIIVGRGDGLRFWHLSFQEFLAARALAARTESIQRKLFIMDRGRLLASEWRETVLLFAGILHRQGAQKVDAMIKTIIEHQEPDASLTTKSQIFGLIGAIQRDLAPLSYEVKEAQYQKMMNQVMRIFTPEVAAAMPLEVRLEAADALGQSGDPRLEADNWVTIEGGKSLMGVQAEDPLAPGYDAGALSIEKPPHDVQLDEFQISRFPVTVTEFEKFIADNGYQEAEFWGAGGYGLWKRPDQWDNQARYPNRPVVGVSWYEALAYSVWKGYGVNLPTEAQWERAARGLVGRKFPWGDDEPTVALLNFNGANLGHITPVGFYPQGVSRDGIYDLAGNVFEWCLDRFGDYHGKVKAVTGERLSSELNYRVVRGGCFSSVTHFVRSAFRGRYDRAYRSNSVGFRICRGLRKSQ